jgi:hypothetical protein
MSFREGGQSASQVLQCRTRELVFNTASNSRRVKLSVKLRKMHSWLRADNKGKEQASGNGPEFKRNTWPNIGASSDQPHGEVKRVHNSGITDLENDRHA